MNGFTKSMADVLPALIGDKKLTVEEIWAFVKICRIARKYCRSGAALNNQLRRAFPYAQFREIPAQDPVSLKRFNKLAITVDGQTADDNEGDE